MQALTDVDKTWQKCETKTVALLHTVVQWERKSTLKHSRIVVHDIMILFWMPHYCIKSRDCVEESLASGLSDVTFDCHFSSRILFNVNWHERGRESLPALITAVGKRGINSSVFGDTNGRNQACRLFLALIFPSSPFTTTPNNKNTFQSTINTKWRNCTERKQTNQTENTRNNTPIRTWQ